MTADEAGAMLMFRSFAIFMALIMGVSVIAQAYRFYKPLWRQTKIDVVMLVIGIMFLIGMVFAAIYPREAVELSCRLSSCTKSQ